MKKHIYIITTILLIAGLTSCNKNWTASDLPQQKMDFSPVVGKMTKGLVTGTTFPTSRSMVLSADHNGTGASGNYFSGVGFSYDSGITAWKPTSGNYYWPISGTLEILAYSGGSVSFSSTPSFTNATSLSMASTDFTADDVLVGGLTGAKYGNNKIAFKHALAKTTFTAYASVGSIIKIKSIELNAKKGATITCSKSSGSSNVTFSTSSHTSAVNISAYSGSTTLTTSEASIGNTILLPANQTPASITVGYTMTVNSTESPVMYVTKTVNQALTSGSGYKYRIYITLTGINVTATLTDWGDGGNIDVPIPDPANGYDYVDLGLRSGGNKILFATMNIGANSPEEYGDYFAWGETSKKYTSISGSTVTGGTFNWNNTPYHTGTDENVGWTKYIPNGMDSYWDGDGSTDNKKTLDLSDDVAHVTWGGGWRMLDKADLEYLISSNVTYEWVTNWESTGVNGYLITGKGDFSSASLFLPAAGYCNNGSRRSAGTNGGYWSSFLNESMPKTAYYLLFSSGSGNVRSDRRSLGYSVRPVLEIPE